MLLQGVEAVEVTLEKALDLLSYPRELVSVPFSHCVANMTWYINSCVHLISFSLDISSTGKTSCRRDAHYNQHRKIWLFSSTSGC